MGLNLDLDPGDLIVVPPDSGAQIRIKEKSGRRTSVVVESAKPVRVLRARDEPKATPVVVDRPRPGGAPPGGRPRT